MTTREDTADNFFFFFMILSVRLLFVDIGRKAGGKELRKGITDMQTQTQQAKHKEEKDAVLRIAIGWMSKLKSERKCGFCGIICGPFPTEKQKRQFGTTMWPSVTCAKRKMRVCI